MEIRHLVFIGPRKASASIEFGSGLNVIYGPSNSGKSSILEAIDFMMARGSSALKELPEHDGYDQILLGLEFSSSETFTLSRSIAGGDFQCFTGLHLEFPKTAEFTVLKAGKPTKTLASLTDFILKKISMVDVQLRKNIRNQKQRLSLRTLSQLFLIDESNIQKEGSPYTTGQYIQTTFERSRLKYFLTAVDDDSLIVGEAPNIKLSRSARISLLNELIAEQELIIEQKELNNTSSDELTEQIKSLDQTVKTLEVNLKNDETQYGEILTKRNNIRVRLATKIRRSEEITDMLIRFSLLDKQYESDLQRLVASIEAGSLLRELPDEPCPLCGAPAHDHKTADTKYAEISDVVTSATAEKGKIERLQEELNDVVNDLHSEKASIIENIPSLRSNLKTISKDFATISPAIGGIRSDVVALVEARTKAGYNIELLNRRAQLQLKKVQIELEAPSKPNDNSLSSGVSKNSAHELSQQVKNLLDSWGLTKNAAIHFDPESDDFVIDGKPRQSNGKGYRAITHAAATLGLSALANKMALPSLGYTILDSPLLAYEKPENESDDLSGTDINVKFFESLANWSSHQIIILENKKSIPPSFEEGEQITHFTKNDESGRYGFFPHEQTP